MSGIEGVVTGNAAGEGGETRGWFFGHFMPDAEHARSDFELKWGVHREGEREAEGWVRNETSATVSLLVEGEILMQMRCGDRIHDVRLTERGDYVLWPPGIEHRFEAKADSVVLSLRCPSVPADQSARDA